MFTFYSPLVKCSYLTLATHQPITTEPFDDIGNPLLYRKIQEMRGFLPPFLKSAATHRKNRHLRNAIALQ
jgi:hypothetical protein